MEIRIVLPSSEVHFLLPVPFPRRWGRPRGIHRGFSTRLRAGTTSIISSYCRAWRGLGPAKKMQGLKAGGRRRRAARRTRGFPTTVSGSGRRDPARTGSLREENGTRQPRSLSCRGQDFSQRVDPLKKSLHSPPPPTTHTHAHTHSRLPSLLRVPSAAFQSQPPAVRRPE